MNLRGSDQLTALLSGRLDNVTPEDMQLLLLTLGGELADKMVDAHLGEGVELSPLQELYVRERLRVFSEAPEASETIRLFRALETNITPVVREHHAWRHERQGNVAWQFSGGTGTGKSSAMLWLLETFNHVRPDDLRKHITIDVPHLPQLLPQLERGSGVAVDEQSKATGEGALTQAKVISNIEDQIRFSEIDILWASPEGEEHTTSQGEFVALGANRRYRYTRFIVYVRELPLGYANIPWCSDAMWAAYLPIKKENVERALRAAFKDTEWLDEVVRRLFDQEAVQKACGVRKLKTPDWRRVLKRHASMLNVSQIQTVAEEIEFMLDTLLIKPNDFAAIYGWDPTPNMLKAAALNAKKIMTRREESHDDEST
ncbi:MAG: hypothetical protein QOE90_3328 [Thermoplasmata archaeon]|jgi:hypothetical protein|nr:hypothetical protein [Thermoplasmata archaeon]